MTIMEMLGQSGVLAVLGMSVVFGFLVTMIIAITVVGKIMQASGAGKEAAPVKTGSAAPAAGAGNGAITAPPVVAAAISAAVNEYRKSN